MRNPLRRRAAAAPSTSQIRQAFELTRQFDSKLVPWMALAFLLPLVIGIVIGLTVGPIYVWGIVGLLLGVLAALITFTRRAQKAMFSSVDGQEGAAGAALSTLRGGWSSEQEPVAIDPRTHDMVFRAIGRGGIVLVTEGPTTRVKKLVEAERKRMSRVLPSVPVTVVNSGHDDGQVELQKLSTTIQRIKPTLSKDEVSDTKKKLRALGGMRPAIPKGMDPGMVKASSRRMRRG